MDQFGDLKEIATKSRGMVAEMKRIGDELKQEKSMNWQEKDWEELERVS